MKNELQMYFLPCDIYTWADKQKVIIIMSYVMCCVHTQHMYAGVIQTIALNYSINKSGLFRSVLTRPWGK